MNFDPGKGRYVSAFGVKISNRSKMLNVSEYAGVLENLTYMNLYIVKVTVHFKYGY